MRLARTRYRLQGGLDLSVAAMIDVVFLLLIFFLVTTTTTPPERLIDPSLAIRKQASAAPITRLDPLMIDVIMVNGRGMFRAGATLAPDLDGVRSLIQEYPDKTPGALIRLADDAPFGMAAVAVNACREAGFVSVSLVPLDPPLR